VVNPIITQCNTSVNTKLNNIMKKQLERLLVRRPCIKLLRQYRDIGAFKAWKLFYWSCPPDFGKLTPQVACAHKLDGYEKGVYDLTIIASTDTEVKVWLIEFKYGKNKYTTEQEQIANNAEGTPVETIKIYSEDAFATFINRKLIPPSS